jgi:hypothetical protein
MVQTNICDYGFTINVPHKTPTKADTPIAYLTNIKIVEFEVLFFFDVMLYKECCLLGYDSVCPLKAPKFRRTASPPSSD